MLLNELNEIANEFYDKCTPSTRNVYSAIINNSFIPYVLQNFGDKGKNAGHLLTYELTMEKIVNIGANYINETKKVKSKSALDTYATCISEFYKKTINAKYPLNVFSNVNPKSLKVEILAEIKEKALREKQSYKHVDENEYRKIVEYFNTKLTEPSNKRIYKKLKKLQVIYQLILLYGFKSGMIVEMKREDYNENNNELTIINENNEKRVLDLPKALSKKISILIKETRNGDYLFVNEKGEKIVNDYFYDTNKELKNILSIADFTTTSMAKYAIINMLKVDLNPLTISDMTSAGFVNRNDIIYDCLQVVKKDLNIFTNEYINTKMKSIKTYRDFD